MLSEEKEDLIEGLIDEIKNMCGDPLEYTGNKLVISRGNSKAKLLIIGEAPGPIENEEGEPFRGPAGILLDEMLESEKFKLDQDIYIINAVFRMPPGRNEKKFGRPSDKVIEYYRPYVLKFIRLIEPKIIVLLGNSACKSVLNQVGITKLRGKWKYKKDIFIMPTYHPSYVQRKKNQYLNLAKNDIKVIREKFNELTEPTM
nr:uracil-DNA glycosylase [uncultured Neisseria sp.]